jgi:hypothetical protein
LNSKENAMTRRNGQSGEGRLGCILWLALLGVGVLICYKAIPVKIASAELYDFMDEQAKWAANTPPEVIKARIIDKAKELELPVDPQNVSVERYGDNIKMRATYMVELEFPGYVYEWNFDHQLNKAIFIF